MKKIYFLATAIVLLSCNKKEEVIQLNQLNATGTYDASSFRANTKQDSSIVVNLKTLLTTIQKARPGKYEDSVAGIKDVKLSVSDLITKYNATGTTTVSSLATPAFSTLIGDANSGLLKDIADASGQDYTLVTPVPDGAKGGRFGGNSGYLFNQYGIDIEEFFIKNYFACLYNKVFTDYLVSDKVSLANVDRALILYGAPTNFPNGITQSFGGVTYTDQNVAGYAARRDNSNGNDKGGYYTTIKINFIRLQNALKANPINASERDAAINEIRENWEKAMAATIINYLWAANSRFALTSPTDADLASGYHALGEGLGLLYGFKGITANKIISNATVNQLLDNLYANTPTKDNNPLKLRSNATELLKLTAAITTLQNTYGFSSDQVNVYFKVNDVSRRNIGYRLED